MEIKWKSGSGFRTDANKAYEVIEGIRTKNDGNVVAEDVVQAAKPKRSPIHGEFEWDDAEAAAEHRRERGRLMLRSLVVVRQDVATDRPQRVYETVTIERGTGEDRPKRAYQTTEDAMKDPNYRAEILGRALRELISIRNRYRDLNELAIVLRAIDEVVASQE